MPQLTIILAVILVATSCTTRVEYGPAAAEDPTGINTAAAADLERLPGIGPNTASAVIRHREQYGAFRRREHLLLVPGISEARYRATLAPTDR